MTDELKHAFDVASALPPSEQNVLAAIMLEEIKSESRWQDLFDQSTDFLDRMAEEALKEHREGKTMPLDVDAI